MKDINDAIKVLTQLKGRLVELKSVVVPPKTTKAAKPTEGYPADFERFWEAYPRSEGKIAAFRCWRTRLKEGFLPEALILAASNYARTKRGEEARHIRLPSTFLGPDKHFLDHVKNRADAFVPQDKTDEMAGLVRHEGTVRD